MSVSPKLAYHLAELEIARTPSAPEHILPVILAGDQAILDVGCGIGQTLVALDLDESYHLVGVDIDVEAIEYGKAHFSGISYAHSTAEVLPLLPSQFDLVISRVALPYTNISVALAEMNRVLKPDGRIWITLHPPSMTLRQWLSAIKQFNVKDIIFRSYVLVNGAAFHLFGKLFEFPTKRRPYESFQTPRSMRKALSEAGFDNVVITRDRHFLIEADKALLDVGAVVAPVTPAQIPATSGIDAQPAALSTQEDTTATLKAEQAKKLDSIQPEEA